MATGSGMAHSTTDPENLARSSAGVSNKASRIEAEMARLARASLEAGAGYFIVAGGKSSCAVTQALGAPQLQIAAKVPRVPWCLATTSLGQIALVLKGGNFGAPRFFGRATRILERGIECLS